MKPHGKGVLAGHRRVGKRFIPPMAALGLYEVGWVEQMLPEFLWLGLLVDRHGLAGGATLALEVARAARCARAAGTPRWYGAMSDYRFLSDEEAAGFRKRLEEARMLRPFVDAMSSLSALYPANPMRSALADVGGARAGGLSSIKRCVAALFNRSGTDAVRVQANALYLAFDGGVMVAAPDSALAEFPEVQHYPDTEKSRNVGSAVRAALSPLFVVNIEPPSDWSRYFWARGLELEPCVVAEDE